MLLRAVLLGLAIGLSPMSARPSNATGAIADEPGAIVLPDAPLLQAVAADMDGDGSRELVRLVRGPDDAAFVEAFALGTGGWGSVGEPVEVLPASRSGPRINPVYAGVPLRLLVHRVAGAERVLVASQPRFNEIDSGPPCCLVLDQVLIEDGELRRVSVSQPTDPVDGILAIDLDGDGTDELLTSRSLPPLGGISFPTEARVYRWADGAFGAPTQTELPIGSGDSPFILGDSDGRPGDEAAIISILGAPGLHRIILGPGDSLSVDDFGSHASGARGVPMAEGRGIVVIVNDDVRIHQWHASSPPGPATATVTVPDVVLLGVVEITGRARVLVHQRASSALHVLRLPDLTGLPGRTVAYSPAAAALTGLPVSPYIGPLPGGGPNGAAAVLFGGRFLPAPGLDPPLPFMGAATSATLAGAEPVGLVADRDWLAILHSPHGVSRISPTGGRLDPPLAHADAWLSIAPMDAVMMPEGDDGLLEPELSGAITTGPRGTLATGPLGFSAEVIAPTGSRVLATDLDPSVVGTPREVSPAGRLQVPVVPPAVRRCEPDVSDGAHRRDAGRPRLRRGLGGPGAHRATAPRRERRHAARIVRGDRARRDGLVCLSAGGRGSGRALRGGRVRRARVTAAVADRCRDRRDRFRRQYGPDGRQWRRDLRLPRPALDPDRRAAPRRRRGAALPAPATSGRRSPAA